MENGINERNERERKYKLMKKEKNEIKADIEEY